ncbi:MAG: gliding motility-associated C-terminal domain-containing protein [Bacteroidota bacterium]
MRFILLFSILSSFWAIDNRMMKIGSSVFFFFNSDEICDNAHDDDGDGLIDLNDPDCDCAVADPVSLIPNPSFEESNCCPTSFSQLSCADTWIQASEATTDYIHECGFLGWETMKVPLPMPDGQACIGFRDGRPPYVGDNEPQPNWKEYTGACLSRPLRANVSYRFEFYIGFTNLTNSPPTNVHFYGTPSCEELPFGQGDDGFGCPTNDPDWQLLGTTFVANDRGWIRTYIDVTPKEDIYAIAIGPDCVRRPRDIHLYYFFDNLILAQQSEFQYQVQPKSGSPCRDDYVLNVPHADTLQYQWYYEGVAIPDATRAELHNPTAKGDYKVLLRGPNSCRITRPYRHQLPVSYHSMTQTICESESYAFNDHHLYEPGTYYDTLKTRLNCDSIVQLDLRMELQQPELRQVKIGHGESYQVGPYDFSKAGDHLVRLQSSHGCDSVIVLQLSHFNYFIPNAFSPNNDRVNDYFGVFGNEDIELVSQLSVFDRWGKLVYRGTDLLPNDDERGWDGTFRGRLSPNGVYIYVAHLLFSDGVERQISGNVTLLR